MSFGPGPEFTLQPVPGVPPLVTADTTLGELDLDLLTKLKAARKLDRDPTATPGAKAGAWTAVADHKSVVAVQLNPFAESARARAAEWQAAASAAEARAASVETLKKTFYADRERLAKLRAAAPDDKRRDELDGIFVAAYTPYEPEIATWERIDTPQIPSKDQPKPPPPPVVSPVLAPLSVPIVKNQYGVIKGDFGAYAQSFSVDTSDDLLSTVGNKPTFDLSGFYAGGSALVNVTEAGGFAIGILAFGRFHVTTSLPDTTFASGAEQDAATLNAPDAAPTGAFATGVGVRLAGNVTERIGMNLGLQGGYLQFLAPDEVPACGIDRFTWDPALRGFQGELFVGWEFYPLSLLSFGVSGRVGFGHVNGEWCAPAEVLEADDGHDQPVDVSSDSFSVGAQGEIGFHF